MVEIIQVKIDKARFLQVGRIFKRVYRPRGAKDVVMTLNGSKLRIEFDGGGAELGCIGEGNAKVQVRGADFGRLVMAYGSGKDIQGTIVLTFRPALGEIGTEIAGARARFLSAL